MEVFLHGWRGCLGRARHHGIRALHPSGSASQTSGTFVVLDDLSPVEVQRVCSEPSLVRERCPAGEITARGIRKKAMHQHTSPAWQNLQSMQSTVACALLVASSTCQLPSAPMGAGARRSSTSSPNRSSTACVQRSGRQLVAQSGAPLQSGSSCSSVLVWQLQEGERWSSAHCAEAGSSSQVPTPSAASRTTQHSRPGCGMCHRSWHARLPQVSRQFHNQ